MNSLNDNSTEKKNERRVRVNYDNSLNLQRKVLSKSLKLIITITLMNLKIIFLINLMNKSLNK